MMGEMMGAPPGKDSSADAAWRFLASPAALELYETLSETLARVVHTERKEDVMRLLAMLLTAQGLQYLRARALVARRVSMRDDAGAAHRHDRR